MWRRIALTLGLMISLVVLIPFATSTAHNLRFQMAAHSRRHHHSRAWWRRHRARVRHRLAMLARRRALALEARNQAAAPSAEKVSDNHVNPSLALPEGLYRDGSFDLPLPNGWSADAAAKGSTSFKISSEGMPASQATLAVVANAPANPSLTPYGREQKNSLAGLPFSELRRTVIDRMISAGGWVVNDRSVDIAGHHVFEVIAQTPAGNDGKGEQVWNFYFTEVNGRIYSLTTHSTTNLNQKLTADAESFLSNFRPVEQSRSANK